ncbi:hypothetical protein KIH39_06060 [Telmatocola sphagniphila]|uniref:Uncharacterized protein n=1 Tax=Telmatocola sphagniphila TaxID=1123043 RepID=A0A8E6BAP3_9BACT|nr:hypothetical protein KIH39_06060 [Telmatocola sphagniphila]
MEIVEYHGWKNNLAIRNKQIELIVTLDVGPRVISFRRLPDGQNVMKNYEEMLGKSGEEEWQIRGGHRFWLAPEDCTRTYYADNSPIKFEKIGENRVRFTPPPEHLYEVQKVMEIELVGDTNKVNVHLIVSNIGSRPTELAPWGPTVMAPGGMEVIPLPAKFPHPGHPNNARSPEDFGPNQELILWPYFDFSDSRWTFGKKYILLRQDSKKGPTKIGLAHRAGWVGYVNRGALFVKRFNYIEGALYPDRGTNYQTFSNEDMLEMETVAPLEELFPDETAELNETWQLYPCDAKIGNEEDVDKYVLPLIR